MFDVLPFIPSFLQAPFDEAQKLTDWTVYKLLMDRKHLSADGTLRLDQWKFVTKFGIRDYVEASFANLFVGSLGDGFVFLLQSNWDRLANELRITGGKLRSPFIAINQGEY